MQRLMINITKGKRIKSLVKVTKNMQCYINFRVDVECGGHVIQVENLKENSPQEIIVNLTEPNCYCLIPSFTKDDR